MAMEACIPHKGVRLPSSVEKANVRSDMLCSSVTASCRVPRIISSSKLKMVISKVRLAL